MPILTPDNLDYLARRVRRWLYGDHRIDAPASKEDLQEMNSDRTGRVAWMFLFGPGPRGIEYRYHSAYGVMDRWGPGDNYEGPDSLHSIEDHFRKEIRLHPPGVWDVVIVLLKRQQKTSAGLIKSASAVDPSFKWCRRRVEEVDG